MSVEIRLKRKYRDNPKGLHKSHHSDSTKKARRKLTGKDAAAQRAITQASRRELWIVDGKRKWRTTAQ